MIVVVNNRPVVDCDICLKFSVTMYFFFFLRYLKQRRARTGYNFPRTIQVGAEFIQSWYIYF